jgi:predicted ATP-dependent protease
MTFDMKAWKEANREKIKLYSVRARLKKKGLPSPETTEQMMAERAAKKAASAERAKQRKREWAAANKARKNARYRERYHNDPEFRRREIDKRMAAFQPKMTEEERAAAKAKRQAERALAKAAKQESRQRAREEEKLKKKKLENARRHALAMERAAKIAPKPKKVTMNTRKPGRLVALAGWMGW